MSYLNRAERTSTDVPLYTLPSNKAGANLVGPGTSLSLLTDVQAADEPSLRDFLAVPPRFVKLATKPALRRPKLRRSNRRTARKIIDVMPGAGRCVCLAMSLPSTPRSYNNSLAAYPNRSASGREMAQSRPYGTVPTIFGRSAGGKFFLGAN